MSITAIASVIITLMNSALGLKRGVVDQPQLQMLLT